MTLVVDLAPSGVWKEMAHVQFPVSIICALVTNIVHLTLPKGPLSSMVIRPSSNLNMQFR